MKQAAESGHWGTSVRYLGIDYGKRRVGLAICDGGQTITSPLAVLEGRGDVFARIYRIVKAESVGALVVGLPLNMDGSEGPQAAATRQFGDKLGKYVGLPVYFQDERLSSFAAEQDFAGIDLPKARRRKPLDAVAAAHILEAFLEAHRA